MTCLNTVNKTLTISLTGSPTSQLEWTTHIGTRDGSSFIEGGTDGVTNNLTAVTMVGPPTSSQQISLKEITVYNPNTGATTFVVKLVNGVNARTIYRVTLESMQCWSSLNPQPVTVTSGSTPTTDIKYSTILAISP